MKKEKEPFYQASGLIVEGKKSQNVKDETGYAVKAGRLSHSGKNRSLNSFQSV